MDQIFDSEYLSPREASKIVDRTTERLRQLADDGRLNALKTPLGRLYRRSDIEALKERLEKEKEPVTAP